jgi:hypothetical protein
VILVSSAVLAADWPGLSEIHPHPTPEKVIYTLAWHAVDTQVMHVLRRPRDQRPRRASGYPEGEPLGDTWLVRCGRLPHRFQQRNKSGCKTRYGVRHAAVGLPNVDPSAREGGRGTPVP